MNLDNLTRRALEVRHKFDSINTQAKRDRWEVKEYTMGLVGDVGDLVKLVMAKENLRELKHDNAAIGHELADCLLGILVIAEDLGIDLEKSFMSAMKEIDRRLAETGK
jgi:NTP pyrophosphatase (non-canonical NTP hydrolase)